MRMAGTLIALTTLILTPVAAAGATGMSPELTVTAEDFDEFLPQVAYNTNRDEFFVVWHDVSFQGRTVMGKRLDRWGNTIGLYTIAYNSTNDSAQPTVAYDPVNDRYLVAYIRDFPGDGSDWDLYGRLVPWNGPDGSLTEFPIVTWGTHQWNPRAAYASTEQEFFVTWWNEDQTGAVASYISGARLSPTTGATVGSTLTIASGTDPRFTPDVAYNRARNEYLIVYTLFTGGQGDVYAVRMNAGGSILGTGEFGVAAWPDAEESPKVAASPTANKWAVVWHSQVDVNDTEIYARFVNGDGTIDGAPVQLVGTTIQERDPEISCVGEGSRFFVAFSQQYSSATGPFGVSGYFLDADHSYGALETVRTVYLGEDDPECGQIAAGTSGSSVLVTWQHNRHASVYRDILGRVVHDPFGDGFESGDFSAWSSVSP